MNDVPSLSATLDAIYAIWLRRRWMMILAFGLVAGALLSLVAALPDLYRSSTTILFGEDVMAESLIKAATSNQLELRLGVVRQNVMSRSQLQDLVDQFDLYPNLRGQVSSEAVINQLRKDITFEQRTSSQAEWGQSSVFVITLGYQTWDPELAAAVANNLAERFEAENGLLKRSQTERASEFIRKELDAARAKFSAQEARINEYKNANMGQLPEQQQINLATLERLNSELQLNGEKQVQLLTRRDALLQGIATPDGNENIAGLSGTLRLDRLKRELADLQLRYTDSYPAIIRLKNEIASLQAELSREAALAPDPQTPAAPRQNPADIDGELEALHQQEQRLRADILMLADRIEVAPKIEQELKSFAADYDVSRDEYLALQRMYQDARLAESLGVQQNQEFKLLEAAIPPAAPAAPNRTRLALMGLILAGACAGAVAFAAELIDSSFHSRADISAFTRVPVIASIGIMRTPGERWGLAMRFFLLAVLAVVCIIALAYFSYGFGTQARQLVWSLSA